MEVISWQGHSSGWAIKHPTAAQSWRHRSTAIAAAFGIARMGDKVSCPKHGNNAIASGDATTIVDGKPVARDGDKTACGAVLVASQQATIDTI